MWKEQPPLALVEAKVAKVAKALCCEPMRRHGRVRPRAVLRLPGGLLALNVY